MSKLGRDGAWRAGGRWESASVRWLRSGHCEVRCFHAVVPTFLNPVARESCKTATGGNAYLLPVLIICLSCFSAKHHPRGFTSTKATEFIRNLHTSCDTHAFRHASPTLHSPATRPCSACISTQPNPTKNSFRQHADSSHRH